MYNALTGVGVLSDPAAVYNEMHTYLRDSGVDGVKVDCQVRVCARAHPCAGGMPVFIAHGPVCMCVCACAPLCWRHACVHSSWSCLHVCERTQFVWGGVSVCGLRWWYVSTEVVVCGQGGGGVRAPRWWCAYTGAPRWWCACIEVVVCVHGRTEVVVCVHQSGGVRALR